MEVTGQLHIIGRLTPGERAPSSYWISRRVGPTNAFTEINHVYSPVRPPTPYFLVADCI